LPNALRELTADGGSLWSRTFAANRALLRDINTYEDALEDESIVSKRVLPATQSALTRLGAGNEKAYCGRDGWLFYRPDIDYVTDAGFLEPKRLKRRASSGNEWQLAPQPDPRKAILQFRDQLAGRGIQLIVVPTPAKPMIHPEKFSARYEAAKTALQNPSYDQFKRDLLKEGVLVFDFEQALVDAKSAKGQDQYLETDTHWRPESMEWVAGRLKEFIDQHAKLPPAAPANYQSGPVEVTNLGDIAVMLQLPKDQTRYRPQTVRVRQVLNADKQLWRPSRSGDALLLGDSFSNIYSLADMGWGESAGLAEQLSLRLQRPIDCILRNDDGAFATRQMLSRELAKGKDRLAGKKLVVWQFAVRELAIGDWKLLDMELGRPVERKFIVPPSGQELTLTGVIESISAAPKPGTVPYKDHIVSAHLTDLEGETGPASGGEAVVYLWSMRDNVWTAAARYRAGQKLHLKLKPWADVSDKLERINRSELSDESLQLEEPCWGEVILQNVEL
jgi:alginate O-acetyltransferase complex protein AlgJ